MQINWSDFHLMFLCFNSAVLMNCSYCSCIVVIFEEAGLPVAVAARSEENLSD